MNRLPILLFIFLGLFVLPCGTGHRHLGHHRVRRRGGHEAIVDPHMVGPAGAGCPGVRVHGESAARAAAEPTAGACAMKILVANLGSTSFKYRLFDMTDERVLARGGVERIGSPQSRSVRRGRRPAGGGRPSSPDHGEAVRLCLRPVGRPEAALLRDPAELAAIGFKAVHAQGRHRRAARRRTACWPRWKRTPTWRRPTIRRTSRRCGCWRGSCRRFRWWRRSRRAFTRRSRRPSGSTPCRWNGREARHPALGLSRRQPSLHRRPDGRAARQRRARRSSPATWAAAVRCVRSGRASRARNSLGMSPQTGLPHNNRVGDFDVRAAGR